MRSESLSSRLGFIMLSAGCAIGLGNIWRFPYIMGQHGGAIFHKSAGLAFVCLKIDAFFSILNAYVQKTF